MPSVSYERNVDIREIAPGSEVLEVVTSALEINPLTPV